MRFTFCLAASAALLATPAAAQTKAAPAKLQPFVVDLTAFAALAPAVPFELGVAKAYREKDVLFTLPLAWEDRVIADKEVKVRVVGYDWTIKPGDVLTRARSASGGDLSRLPEKAPIYCGEYFQRTEAFEADLLARGLPMGPAFVTAWLQLCLVDSDSDGRFDHGFLVGTKKTPDRTMVAIEPAAYVPRRLEPIADSRLEVVCFDGGPLIPPNFELHLFLEGERVPLKGLSGFTFPENAPPAELNNDKAGLKKWEETTPSRLAWFVSVNRKKIPQTFTIGSARFTVHSIDKTAKTATVTLDRAATPFLFSVHIAEQPTPIIYIYVPR